MMKLSRAFPIGVATALFATVVVQSALAGGRPLIVPISAAKSQIKLVGEPKYQPPFTNPVTVNRRTAATIVPVSAGSTGFKMVDEPRNVAPFTNRVSGNRRPEVVILPAAAAAGQFKMVGEPRNVRPFNIPATGTHGKTAVAGTASNGSTGFRMVDEPRNVAPFNVPAAGNYARSVAVVPPSAIAVARAMIVGKATAAQSLRQRFAGPDALTRFLSR
jgi:hypothetical protein